MVNGETIPMEQALEEGIMQQEIPVPGTEPSIITPMAPPPMFVPGGPDVPYFVPSQEPESVPPLPQEAS